MVESIANLPQEKMEMFSRDAADRIEPVFRIAPEPFDPIEVIPSFRVHLLLADAHKDSSHSIVPSKDSRSSSS